MMQFSFSMEENLTSYLHCLNESASTVAFRSFHGFNIQVSNDGTDEDGYEIFDIAAYFDDLDPTRNGIFETVSIIQKPDFAPRLQTIRFQGKILGMWQNKIAFFSAEHYNTTSRSSLIFEIQNEIVGTETFSLKTSQGHFLSINTEVINVCVARILQINDRADLILCAG